MVSFNSTSSYFGLLISNELGTQVGTPFPSEIQGTPVEKIRSLTMKGLLGLLSGLNKEELTPLDLKVLLPLLFDKLPTDYVHPFLSDSSVIHKIDKDVIGSLSMKHCLQLTATLHSKLSEDLLHTLPHAAQAYQSLLNSGFDSPTDALSAIDNLSGLTKEERLVAMALFIESARIAFTDLSKDYLQEQFMMEIAPYLRYVDVNGLDVPFISAFIKQCRNACVLECSNTLAEALPDEMPMISDLHCSNTPIDTLPDEMPMIKCLEISHTAIDTLPSKMTHLRTLSCSSTLLNRLPEDMNRLHKLDFSHTYIQTLPANLTQLRALLCVNTPISKLPDQMPQLETLEISQTDVTVLPANMPNLKRLAIAFTFINDLSAHMPDLRHLNIEGTPISVLPADVHQLKSLNIAETSIDTLPAEMADLEWLNCSETAISTLFDKMHRIKRLNCSDCPITSLPNEMPLLEDLRVRSCDKLDTMPVDLPKCSYMDYSFSEGITGLPFLAFGAKAIAEHLPAFSSLRVDCEKFDTDPVELLLELGNYLLSFRAFPNIIYYENNERNIARDVGGLRNDFLTKLLRKLFKQNIQENELEKFLKITEDSLPQTKPKIDHEKKAYQTLGLIIALCMVEGSDFRTGPLFSNQFYTLLNNPFELKSDNWFLRNLLHNKLYPKALAFLLASTATQPSFTEKDLEVLAVYTEIDVMQHELLRKELLELAKTDRTLQALSWIAEQMQNKLGSEALKRTDPIALKEQIEGTLSAEALIQSLEWEFEATVTEQERHITQGYLISWIKRHSDQIEKLSLFVMSITGNLTLCGKPLRMQVDRRGKDFLPKAHICFKTLELTSQCESKETFAKYLEILLEQTGVTAV